MTNRAAVLTAIVLLALTASASAQVPLGPEFRVDTTGADSGIMGDLQKKVTMTPDGRFVVVWPTAEPIWWMANTAARRFDSRGVASGPDFVVNSYTAGGQYDESIASDDAGNFVVVWYGLAADGFSTVFGQRFDAAGARLGTEFRVNATSGVHTFQPSIAMTPGGEYTVVWRADGSIFARVFSTAGAPVTSDILVSTSTTVSVQEPSVDSDGAGNFVVVWRSGSNNSPTVSARLFDASGVPLGGEFLVNTGTESAVRQRVARARDGSFVVAWQRLEASTISAVARRFDASGVALGPEAVVGPMSANHFYGRLDLDMDVDGDFVVVWDHNYQIFARRFDVNGNSGPLVLVTGTGPAPIKPSVATDAAGNFVVVWRSYTPGGNPGVKMVRARRYAGGLSSAALAVDATALSSSDGNGVLEAGETVAVEPSWLNANFTAQTFTGAASTFTGPGAAGNPAYTIVDGSANYGTVAVNVTGNCGATSDCFSVGVTVPTTRPAVHWDAALHEDISPANLGASKTWTLHVGESFADMPRASGFYRFVETLLHHGVTSGCSTGVFCPTSTATREQMAVFALVAKEGPGFVPPACVTPVFNDVPASSPFCPWIEELARRGVVGGCGNGSFCPGNATGRDQMAVFVLRTMEPALVPPGCGTPRFNDVPASSPFCPWIEELARRSVVTGCGGGNYCPTAPLTREQIAVFISAGFDLRLYGP
jgi:hypothetical protein